MLLVNDHQPQPREGYGILEQRMRAHDELRLARTDAIGDRLRQLKGSARGWTVVSSDRAVHANARSAGASVLASEDFALLLTAQQTATAEVDQDIQVTDEEIKEWLDLFGAGE